MRCARCGRDADPESPRCAWCPHCGGGNSPHCAQCPRRAQEETDRPEERISGADGKLLRCPDCGCTRLSATRRGYDPSFGCLGLMLFSWVGLLLGLLEADRITLVCGRCGKRWSPGWGKEEASPLHGCSCLLVIILLAVLAAAIVIGPAAK